MKCTYRQTALSLPTKSGPKGDMRCRGVLSVLVWAPEMHIPPWYWFRIALQVKGGRYILIEGRWHLETDAGRESTPCPLAQTRDGAFSIQDAVWEEMTRRIYLIPVLLFPDMEPDPDIEDRAAHDITRILWGSHDLVNRLLQLAAEVGVKYPPTRERIRREAAVVSPGLCLPDALEMAPEATPEAAPEALEMTARQVVIQHANTVNIHTIGASDGLPGGVA